MIHRGISLLTRRGLLAGLAAGCVARVLPASAQEAASATDVTFLFTNDVHACRMETGLSPSCQQEGKTDENLLRHIAALNALAAEQWPATIGGVATGLRSAGRIIGQPAGLVIGGDMTDDGGGQVTLPSEGTQLLQFSHRYQEGTGPDRVHMPVFAGLGNHDLDQDGPPDHRDWYRRELRDYVELNHRPSVIFKPPVPASDYDLDSDCYSWAWGGLHLVQLHRFAGDTRKSATDSLPWLKANLARFAADGRPVILFQHYGWDSFSIERFDPEAKTFDDHGTGDPHWWSDVERQAMLEIIAPYNIVGIFHGHEHDTPMAYRQGDIDLFKPIAAFKGGYAVARVTGDLMDVVLGHAGDAPGSVVFTNAFSKAIAARPK